MNWIEIKTEEDIRNLQKIYGNFEDSTLVNFRFESGNYVDEKRVSHEYNNNNLYVLFQRLENAPFSIELMFEYAKRINFFAPIGGMDKWRSEIDFAKIIRNDEFYYWTQWEEFDPYDEEHLKYNDFILIEAKKIRWRIVEENTTINSPYQVNN